MDTHLAPQHPSLVQGFAQALGGEAGEDREGWRGGVGEKDTLEEGA